MKRRWLVRGRPLAMCGRSRSGIEAPQSEPQDLEAARPVACWDHVRGHGTRDCDLGEPAVEVASLLQTTFEGFPRPALDAVRVAKPRLGRKGRCDPGKGSLHGIPVAEVPRFELLDREP